MADVLEILPPRWREDRMILGERSRWDGVEVLGDDDGVVLLIGGPLPSVLGLGASATVDRLVSSADIGRARWMSVPRGCRIGADTLDGLGLVPFSTWDWLSTTTVPPTVAGENEVRRLDPDTDADAIRACLRESNPGTSADPAGPDELGWWGVHGDGRLLGVVGAAARGAAGDGRSWHVHGLGVLPTARRSGMGTALTAALTRAALSGGDAAWVSLGMYAQNDEARRIYRRLGFRTDAELSSFSPPGALVPSA